MSKKIKTGLYSLQENYNIFGDGNMQKLFKFLQGYPPQTFPAAVLSSEVIYTPWT